MVAWWVAGGAVVFGLALVVAMLVAERRRVPRAAGAASDRAGLPSPDEIADPALPIVWRGYAPVATDAHLDRVAAAYTALYDSADDAARARADVALGGGAPGGPTDGEPAPTHGQPDPSGQDTDAPTDDAGRAPGAGIS